MADVKDDRYNDHVAEIRAAAIRLDDAWLRRQNVEAWRELGIVNNLMTALVGDSKPEGLVTQQAFYDGLEASKAILARLKYDPANRPTPTDARPKDPANVVHLGAPKVEAIADGEADCMVAGCAGKLVDGICNKMTAYGGHYDADGNAIFLP